MDEITQGGLTNDEITQLTEAARQIAVLRSQIAELVDRKEALTALLRSKLKPTEDLYKFGDRTVSVVQTTVFDEVQARKVLTIEQLGACLRQVTVVDDALAKAVLPPAVYVNCRIPRGKATVTVK